MAGHASSIFVGPTPGVVYKPVTQAEVDFYEQVRDDARWQAFLASYVGAEANVSGAGERWPLLLKLRDLTHGYRHPCVLDVKLGLSTVVEGQSERKQSEARKKDLETTTHALALRICGIKVLIYLREFAACISWLTVDVCRRSLRDARQDLGQVAHSVNI